MKDIKHIINLINLLFSNLLFGLVMITSTFLYVSAFFMGEEHGDVVMAVILLGFYFGLPIVLLIMCVQVILWCVQFVLFVLTLIFSKRKAGKIMHILFTLVSYIMVAWQTVMAIVLQLVLLLFAISYGTTFWMVLWEIIGVVAIGMACCYFALVIAQTVYVFLGNKNTEIRTSL